MRCHDESATDDPSHPGGQHTPLFDVTAEARDLVAGLLERPWGDPSPSVYETARLVAMAPWLTGHSARVAYLVDTQRPDGLWGPHQDYALVPTLSATDALLAEVVRCDPAHTAVAEVAERALRALHTWSDVDFGAPFPDMPAIELIAPSLVASINRRVCGLGDPPVTRLNRWATCPPLPFPRGMDETPVQLIRSRLRAGGPLPVKLLHALEVAGDAAYRAIGVRPTPSGTVGASPAATVAWLGEPGTIPADLSVPAYLEESVRLHGGPVSCAVPITAFERGWVIGWLLRAGVPVTVPEKLVASLAGGLGPEGMPAGPGLPEDADTTSVALYTLAALGVPHRPDSLWAYHTGTHFCTWPGEQGSSTTVNAHVLDAFGRFAAERPGDRPRYDATIGELAAWLRGRQRADGSWTDRWHASPYYATTCCALALGDFALPESREAVRRAVDWVLSTQRPDGSWGLWCGTAEETAYALHLLLLTGTATESALEGTRPGTVHNAVVRGRDHLLRSAGQGGEPPMWHDKDLYLPGPVVRAAIIGALHLARSFTPRADALPHTR